MVLIANWSLRSLYCAGGLLVQSGRLDGSTGEEEWGLQLEAKDAAAALDAKGIFEGPLKKSIAAAFPTTGIPRQLFASNSVWHLRHTQPACALCFYESVQSTVKQVLF